MPLSVSKPLVAFRETVADFSETPDVAPRAAKVSPAKIGATELLVLSFRVAFFPISEGVIAAEKTCLCLVDPARFCSIGFSLLL